jgi:hypothetical protein
MLQRPRANFRHVVLAITFAAASSCSGDSTAPGSDSTGTTPPPIIPPGPYVPGRSYFGRNGYIEYIAGNTPVIYSAPHGGDLTPSEIPDRTAARCGGSATTSADLSTVELVRAMQERHFARYGTYPHIVINHLARRKLDPNRTEPEAACGSAAALVALAEWHAFMDAAKATAIATSGKGWYMDMHGHGHVKQRLELGYLLSSAELALPDAVLDANRAFQDTASVRTVSEASPATFSALLRGATSLGSLYAANGFPSVPSAADPSPGSDDYFAGGDDTRRHACGAEASALGGLAGGNICGVQIEANFTGVRDTPANRERFADVTAVVLQQYLATHWKLDLGARPERAGAPAAHPERFAIRGQSRVGANDRATEWSKTTQTPIAPIATAKPDADARRLRGFRGLTPPAGESRNPNEPWRRRDGLGRALASRGRFPANDRGLGRGASARRCPRSRSAQSA